MRSKFASTLQSGWFWIVMNFVHYWCDFIFRFFLHKLNAFLLCLARRIQGGVAREQGDDQGLKTSSGTTRRRFNPEDSSEKEGFMVKLSTHKLKSESRGNWGKHRGSSYMRTYSRKIKRDPVYGFMKM